MTGAAMIGAALFSRQRTGTGQLVSTSLLRQGAYTIGFDVNIALLWGRSMSTGTGNNAESFCEQLRRR